jgi:hypothetical protein
VGDIIATLQGHVRKLEGFSGLSTIVLSLRDVEVILSALKYPEKDV